MSSALELAKRYMDCFYGDAPLEGIKKLLADELDFEGPLFKYQSADEYYQSLQASPPVGVTYELINEFENGSAACLVYRFLKPGIDTVMAQYFEVENGKISKIRLVFDAAKFC